MTYFYANPDELKRYCESVFNQNLPKIEASIVADTLIDADLQGVSSHGIQRMKGYLERLDNGLIKNKTKITVVSETPTSTVLDANNGWGQVASLEATKMTINKTKEKGTAFIGVRNSNHFGTCAYYTRMIAEEQLIGIAMTNASPFMVPYGSKEPSLGANPISISIPVGPNQDPIVLDMSTSNVARGKIMVAKKNNEEIPDDWAITKEGNTTTDPHEAWEGFLLPLGPKGSGLAIMIDILSGILTGSLFGKQIPKQYGDPYPQQVGHLFGAIDIKNFIDLDEFYENVQEKINETITSKPSAGFTQVQMPGDSKIANRKTRIEEGIPISKTLYDEIKETGQKYGVNIKDFL